MSIEDGESDWVKGEPRAPCQHFSFDFSKCICPNWKLYLSKFMSKRMAKVIGCKESRGLASAFLIYFKISSNIEMYLYDVKMYLSTLNMSKLEEIFVQIHEYWRWQKLSPSIRKKVFLISWITDPYLFYLFSVKYIKDASTRGFTHI